MNQNTVMQNFEKHYQNQEYKHTQLINHKGTLISFALDSKRGLHYSVLNMNNSTISSELDVKYWSNSPLPVPFPNELRKTGYGDFQIYKMPPMYSKKNGPILSERWRTTTARLTADAPFKVLSDNEHIYLFRQAISASLEENPTLTEGNKGPKLGSIPKRSNTITELDGGIVPSSLATLLRGKNYTIEQPQLVVGVPQKKWALRDNGRTCLIEESGSELVVFPLLTFVDNTLLVDRFILANGYLQPRLDVRYRRSRRKDTPDSSTDVLGAYDMNGVPFYEATQELKFITHLEDGKFNILLIPTQEASVTRWQIFAYNAATKRIDSYNIERSEDGLFNTKGRQYFTSPDPNYQDSVFEKEPGKCPFTGEQLIPIVKNEWYAETCLQLDGSNYVTVKPETPPFQNPQKTDFALSSYTVEAWVKPIKDARSNKNHRALVTQGEGGFDNQTGLRNFNLWLWADSSNTLQIYHAWSSGQKGTPSTYEWNNTLLSAFPASSNEAVQRGAWNHIAITNGPVQVGAQTKYRATTYLNGKVVAVKELADKPFAPDKALNLYIGRSYSNLTSNFKGQIDEVRIWNRARGASEINETMKVRLLGDEVGLVGYWRMDEGRADKVCNHAKSTAGRAEGKISGAGSTAWAQSGAPIGDSPGIRMSSMGFEGREITAGPAATLYHQLEEYEVGDSAENSLKTKQNARVMLAVPTKQGPSGTSQTAIIDFAVSREGRLGQIADMVKVNPIDETPTVALNPTDQANKTKWMAELADLKAKRLLDLKDVRNMPCHITLAEQTVDPWRWQPSLNEALTETFEIKVADSATWNVVQAAPASSQPIPRIVWRLVTILNHDKTPRLEGNKRVYEVIAEPSSPNADRRKLKAVNDDIQFGAETDSGDDSKFFVTPHGLGYVIESVAHPNQVITTEANTTTNFGLNPNERNFTYTHNLQLAPKNFSRNQIWHVSPTVSAISFSIYDDLIADLESKLANLTKQEKSKYPMQLLGVDRYGLSTAAGLLTRVETTDTPHLFNNAEGNVALYYKNSANRLDKFFSVAYFNPNVRRRVIEVDVGEGQVMRFIARNAECKASLTYKNQIYRNSLIEFTFTASGLPGHSEKVVEKFKKLPQEVDLAADVINGIASQPLFIGKIAKTRAAGNNTVPLTIDRIVQQRFFTGQPLLIGGVKVYVAREPEISNQAPFTTAITLSDDAKPQLTKGEAVYLLPYDYDRAQSFETESGKSLAPTNGSTFKGSRFFYAIPPTSGMLGSVPAPGAIKERTYATGFWTAFNTGNSLNLSGQSMAQTKGVSLSAENEMTVEAWVQPLLQNQSSRLVTYHSPNNAQGELLPNFGLSLLKDSNQAQADVIFHVDGQTIQTTKKPIKGNAWSHIAAMYRQSYAIGFDGGYLDCGSDEEWNMAEELSIEVSLTRSAKSASNHHHGIFSKGRLSAGQQNAGVPYALEITPDKRVRFSFETVGEGRKVFETAPNQISDSNKVYTISVVRRGISAEMSNLDLNTYDPALANLTVTKNNVDNNKEKIASAQRADYLLSKKNQKFLNQQRTGGGTAQNAFDIRSLAMGLKPQKYHIEIYVNGNSVLAQECDNTKVLVNTQPLEIGRVLDDKQIHTFKGTISEIRIWSRALFANETGKRITGSEKGLVNLWRFSERDGTAAFDERGGKIAQFNGSLSWEKSRNPLENEFTIYVNGESRPNQPASLATFDLGEPQLAVGAYGDQQGDLKHGLNGKIQEVRIWRQTRTIEQIQDNLFTSIQTEQKNLAAYYPCTIYADSLKDYSLSGAYLTFTGDQKPTYNIQTAPIGADTANVRSAFADLASTNYQTTIDSTPAVREYGDLQDDSNGEKVGILKRCYAFVRDKKWVLVTGFKVGDLISEWMSQVQFNPQIKGYIEGPPPVPSENLTEGLQNADTAGNFMDASAVTFTQADSIVQTVSSSREDGFGSAFDIGVTAGVIGKMTFVFSPLGIGLGLEPQFEFGGYMKAGIEGEQSTSSSRMLSTQSTVTSSLSSTLGGSWEESAANPALNRRFVPANMGIALVESDTADVFALRLKHTNAIIGLQFVPNTDIPKDVNIIPFPINPRYTKLGTLDGIIGYDEKGRPKYDEDYEGLKGGGEYSYYKPREAYALKRRIQAEHERIKAIYTSYLETKDTKAGGIGAAAASGTLAGILTGSTTLTSIITMMLGASNFMMAGVLGAGFASVAGGMTLGNAIEEAIESRDLPKELAPRNIVNTYVWTADGGFYEETTNHMVSHQTTTATDYAFKGAFSAGMYLNSSADIGPQHSLELNGSMGGHFNINRTKSEEKSRAFGLDISIDVPGDLQKFSRSSASAPLRRVFNDGQPVNVPGKVDAYRFMTFYLAPETDNYDALFNKVADPIWLQQSDHPNAIALRQAKNSTRKPPCWRVMHRVTFRSRILPDSVGFTNTTQVNNLDTALRKINVESHWQIIRRLDPLLRNSTSDISMFREKLRQTVRQVLPYLNISNTQVEDELFTLMANHFELVI